MASCFQLFEKETNQIVSLSSVDDAICTEVLNTQPHPKLYGGTVFDWFNSIGFMIAIGKPLGSQELRDHYLADESWAKYAPVIKQILDYMESKYTSRSFYSR